MTEQPTLAAAARDKRLALLQGRDDVNEWPVPPLELVPERHQEAFLLNSLAVSLWVRLVPETAIMAQVAKVHGVQLRQGRTAKLVERCLRKNPKTGDIYGFLGCVPGMQLPDATNAAVVREGEDTQPPKRRRSRELRKLFDEHPTIEAAMVRLVKTRRLKKGGPQFPALDVGVITDCFYTLCQRAGREKEGKWPFEPGLVKKGREAIRRWYHEKKFDNPAEAALNELGDEVGEIMGRDLRRIGIRSLNIPLKMGYERVEIDEHHRDAMFCAFWRLPNGTYRTLPASRTWALVAVDCGFHAVLGTHVALGNSYGRNDVARLFLNVLEPPPRPLKLMLEDEQYQLLPEAKYPAEIAGYERNTFQTIAWDGHKSHFSKQMLADVIAVTHAQVSGERIGDSTARPNIEGWFLNLTRFDHMLPSSVGSAPDSPHRRDPEGNAERHRIYMPFATESLDVLGRTHNITPLACLDGDTPLERMLDWAKQGRIFHSPLGALGRSRLHLLLPRFERELADFRAVGADHGVLGVNLRYGRYTSKELNSCKELRFAADRRCILYVNEDARSAWLVARALPGRRFLVTIAGRWAEFPHSLQFRSFICAIAKKRVDEGRARLPHLGVGALSALSRVAESEAAAAQMIAGFNSFAERWARGQVTEVDVSRTEVADALAYTQGIEPEDDLNVSFLSQAEVDATERLEAAAAGPVNDNPLGPAPDILGLKRK